jgi:hypothetical protein
VDTETVTVNGDATYTTPTGYTLPTSGKVTGTYAWSAAYTPAAGDNNTPSSDPGTSAQEQFTILPAALGPFTTTASPTGVTLGTTSVTLKDSATLSGGFNPTGTITFTLGLRCRRCGHQELKVIYTRRRRGGKVGRRRECRNCGSRISTCEREVCG